MINGDRLKLAREFLGLSQTELAERAGVTQSMIAYIENGRFPPSEALAGSIAKATGFPLPFFKQPNSVNAPLGSLLFRAKKTQVSQADKTKANRFAQLAFELSERLMSNVRPLPVRVPSVQETPTMAARITRTTLGLSPDKPISNVVNALERAGILVAIMPDRIEGLDGFSLWSGPSGDQPVIILAPGLPPDRLRLTAAHELGHLALHRSVDGDLKQIEDEAWEFAGEFLFPEESMRQEVLPPVTLASLAALKPRWGMSMIAMVMRAEKLRIITPRQKTYLIQQLKTRKWWDNEPGSDLIPVERPRALRQLAEMKYGADPNWFRIASDVHWPVNLVELVLSAFAPGTNRHQRSGSGPGKVVPLWARTGESAG